MNASSCLILASRSPRRRELLSHLLPPDRFEVLAPASSEEPGFDDCHDLDAIKHRMLDIVRLKINQVRRQIDPTDAWAILAADTIVVARDERDRPIVLGQPPEQGDWQRVVKLWFERYYFEKPHLVMTAVMLDECESRGHGQSCPYRLVSTEIWFDERARGLVDWYLSTGESLGKAGGYGIQGAAASFLKQLTGSLTNVIGLPLLETRELLVEAGLVEA